jgi:peptidoglycan hydrolase-like protein with peptidoglycan-binding domain
MPMPQPGKDFDPDDHAPAPDDHELLTAAALPTLWGFDYAWERDTPAQLINVLRANKAQFALRYINDAVPGGKGLTAAEAAALEHAGIIIGPIWETTGTDFTAGYNAGLADGRSAAAALRGHEAPAGTVCWFAIDTDTSNTSATNAYLRGAKDGTGSYIAQLYGSYGVVEAAAAAGLGSSHFQTYAWSRGQLSRHALVYQYQNGVMIGGISMDRDRTIQAMAGPWAHPASAPEPAPTPPHPQPEPAGAPAFPYPAGHYLGKTAADTHCHSGAVAADQPHVLRWQAQMAGRRWTIAADGRFGDQSDQVCRAFQRQKGLTVDGKVGPDTWAKSWTAPVTAGTAGG